MADRQCSQEGHRVGLKLRLGLAGDAPAVVIQYDALGCRCYAAALAVMKTALRPEIEALSNAFTRVVGEQPDGPMLEVWSDGNVPTTGGRKN